MIEDLGRERCFPEEASDAYIQFVRCIIYGDKQGGDLVATKVRMYHDHTKKTTSSLPADPNSMRFDILRKHHQAYTWKRCLQALVEPLPLNDNGWKVNDEGLIIPIWYTCSQLPPGMCKKGHVTGRKGKSSKSRRREFLNLVKSSCEPPTKRGRGSEESVPLEMREDEQMIEMTDADNISDVGFDNIVSLSELEEEEEGQSDWEHLSEFGDSTSDSSSDSDWTL